MTMILVSRDYGAGWSTWASDDKQKAIAEYAPIVAYVEAGKPILHADKPILHADFRALVEQMMVDLDLDDFYTGGAIGLSVEEVHGPYYIEEYDGHESVRTAADFWT